MPLIDGKMIAQADIHDWYEATLRAEVEIPDDKALLKLVDDGMPTGEIVRHGIVNQEVRGKFDLLGPNKLLLYSGGRAALAERIHAQRETVQINGHAYDMPKYVGPFKPEADDAPQDQTADGAANLTLDMPGMEPVEPPLPVEMPTTYSPRNSARAAHVAQEYLRRVVPGHIEPRLVMLREQGMDVREAGEKLKGEIDAMVNRLL